MAHPGWRSGDPGGGDSRSERGGQEEVTGECHARRGASGIAATECSAEIPCSRSSTARSLRGSAGSDAPRQGKMTPVRRLLRRRVMVTFIEDSRRISIPGWVTDLESFRRWTDNEEFPEDAKIWWLRGEV